MDKLIELLVELFRKLFMPRATPIFGTIDEVHFLRERKKLAAEKIWLLELLEAEPTFTFTTEDLYNDWLPIVLRRTAKTPEDVSLDSCFTRLDDLREKHFLKMIKDKKRGKLWTLSDAYFPFLIPRDNGMTIIQADDD